MHQKDLGNYKKVYCADYFLGSLVVQEDEIKFYRNTSLYSKIFTRSQ